MVVVGNAISRGNPELEEVLDRKIRYCSLPEAVRDHFLWGSRSVVIAGTHGKTTTTSLTGWLLAHGGADPSVFIGGIAENFESSYRIGGGREFVIEGDEYDSAFFDKTAKFLKYLPDIAVVNNIEYDHADIYPDLASIRLAFQRFVNLIPRRGLLLLGADNAEALALGAARALPRRDVRPVGRRRLAGARPQGRRPPRPRSACGSAARPIGALRSAAARRLQRPQRAGGDRRRRRGRPEHRHDARGAAPFQRRAPPDGAARHGRRRRGLRRFRASPDGDRRNARGRPLGVSRPRASGRSSSRARRPPAAASSSEDFARALAKADHVILPAVFRSSLPDDQRLSAEQLVADLQREGVDARYIPKSTTSSNASRRKPPAATSSSSCRTAASTTSTRSSWLRSELPRAADRAMYAVPHPAGRRRRASSSPCARRSIRQSMRGALRSRGARSGALGSAVRDAVVGYCSVTVYFDPLHRRIPSGSRGGWKQLRRRRGARQPGAGRHRRGAGGLRRRVRPGPGRRRAFRRLLDRRR